jgi:hypothetical protein
MSNQPGRVPLQRRISRWIGDHPELLGGLFLLLLLCGFAVSLIQRYLTSELRTIVKLIPEDATVTAMVSVTEDDWQQVLDYGTSDSQAVTLDTMGKAATRLAEVTGLEFDRDVRPWIGDRLFVAMLPPRNVSNDMAPETISTGYAPVFFLPVESPRRARQALEQASAVAGAWTEREYKGLTIADSDTFSVVQIEKMAIISPDRTAIDRTIDAYLDETTIAQVEGYGSAWDVLAGSDSFAALYFNVESASEFLASQSVGRVDSVDRPPVRTQGSMVTLFLTEDGVELNGLSWLAPSSDRRYDRNVPTPQIAEVIPDFAVAAIVGLDFPQIWRDYLRDSQVNALLPIDPQWLRSALSSTLNLDLEKDIIAWTTGEFALAAIPSASTQSPLPLGVAAFVDTTDPKPADTFFEKLDRTVRDRYGITVEPEKVGDRTVLRWTMRQQGLTVEHGWLTRTMAFFSIGAVVSDTFVGGVEVPLVESDRFRAALPSNGLANRNGFFYLDVATLLASGGLGSLRLPVEQDAIVRAIESITVTGGIQDERRSRYDVFVRLVDETNSVE